MSAVDEARTTAEAVRRLAQATLDPGAGTVAETYMVLGSLAETVAGLHQTAGQLARVLGHRLAGDLHQDRGHRYSDPAEAIAAALDALSEVAGLLEPAAAGFDRAQQAIAWTAEPNPDNPSAGPDEH